MKKIIAVAVVILLLISAPIAASAATTTQTIEVETRSALLIDKSGSMEEQKAVEVVISQCDLSSYDAVVYFDQRLSTKEDFTGGGNSHICEAIDQLVDGGFAQITVVTDGEQWPSKYSALGVYTDVDLTIKLVEETKQSQEFINQLKSRLVNSSLKVSKPDGTEDVILDDYKKPIYTIEIPVVEDETSKDSDTEVEDVEKITIIENAREGYFPWWLILILAAVIAAIFDLIHELIARGRDKDDEDENDTPTEEETKPAPMPEKAVMHIKQGAHVVADFSGSMAAQQSETARACLDVGSKDKVICFGERVKERKPNKLSSVHAEGRTAGWEALEKASSKCWDEIVLVSDLGFNGKAFDQNAFAKKFKKVTVVTPKRYSMATLENLKKIADEVEVLPL